MKGFERAKIRNSRQLISFLVTTEDYKCSILHSIYIMNALNYELNVYIYLFAAKGLSQKFLCTYNILFVCRKIF